MIEREPLPLASAPHGLARCAVATVVLLARRRVHLPRGHAEWRLGFTDGTSACVYRETVRLAARDPCVLVVKFRLRGVRGWDHAVFRTQSLLNIPAVRGVPGYVSKRRCSTGS